jgi:DNA adenine methylase
VEGGEVKPRPILRWHGGKWLLADWIISHFPRHRSYVEPYCGAASVLLRKTRSHDECINDLDGEIVNLFRVARDAGAELARVCALTPFSRDEFFRAYDLCDDPLERARRLVVRSFQGFGSNSATSVSGFRSLSRRSGGTPATDWQNWPEALMRTVDRLRGVVIENRPAIEVMRARDDAETLHYVDPPYVHVTRGTGSETGYRKQYRHEMSDTDHDELAAFLKTLKGGVVLSGYRSEIYDDLFSDWRRIDRATHADGARARVESLWLSPSVAQPSLFWPKAEDACA